MPLGLSKFHLTQLILIDSIYVKINVGFFFSFASFIANCLWWLALNLSVLLLHSLLCCRSSDDSDASVDSDSPEVLEDKGDEVTKSAESDAKKKKKKHKHHKHKKHSSKHDKYVVFFLQFN